MKNVNLDWSALKAWQPSKMTSNLPKLGLISFLSLSRTQKTVCPKISKIWDAALMSTEDHILTNSSRKKGSEIPEVLYQRTPGNKRRLAMDVKNLMAKVKNYYSEAGRPR